MPNTGECVSSSSGGAPNSYVSLRRLSVGESECSRTKAVRFFSPMLRQNIPTKFPDARREVVCYDFSYEFICLTVEYEPHASFVL